MFRFTSRATGNGNPQAAFANGAKFVNYMGRTLSRRHCNQTQNSLRAGFIDPCRLAGTLPTSAMAMILWTSIQGASSAGLALTSEDSVPSMLTRMMSGSSMAALTTVNCSGFLSRSLQSNFCAVQWKLTVCMSCTSTVLLRNDHTEHARL